MQSDYRVKKLVTEEGGDVIAVCYDVLYGETFDKYIGIPDDFDAKENASNLLQDSNYEISDEIRAELEETFGIAEFEDDQDYDSYQFYDFGDDDDEEDEDEFGDEEEFTVPTKYLKRESFNLREALNQIDLNTYNKYDLLNLYESCGLNENEKRALANIVYDQDDPSVIYDTLNNRFLGKEIEMPERVKDGVIHEAVDNRFKVEGVWYPGEDKDGDYIEEPFFFSTDDATEFIDFVWDKIQNAGIVEITVDGYTSEPTGEISSKKELYQMMLELSEDGKIDVPKKVIHEDTTDRPVEFKAGYHEWNVLLNGEIIYSFGDFGETLEGCTDKDTLGYEVEDCIQVMLDELNESGKNIQLTNGEFDALKNQMVAKLGYHYLDLDESLSSRLVDFYKDYDHYDYTDILDIDETDEDAIKEMDSKLGNNKYTKDLLNRLVEISQEDLDDEQRKSIDALIKDVKNLLGNSELKEDYEADTMTFAQWFDENKKHDDEKYYPFDNYVKTFENAEVLRNATARDILNNAHIFYDVYPVDSVDREYAFHFASELLGLDYDVFYDAWLSGSPVPGTNLEESKSINESDEDWGTHRDMENDVLDAITEYAERDCGGCDYDFKNGYIVCNLLTDEGQVKFKNYLYEHDIVYHEAAFGRIYINITDLMNSKYVDKVREDKFATESKSIEESDEETPYTKEEVERDLKSITHNFTDKEGELKCGFEEEKDLGVEILKQHYEIVEVSGDDRRDGTWYHISFAEPIVKESLDHSPLFTSGALPYAIKLLWEMDKFVLDVYDNESWLMNGIPDGEFNEDSADSAKQNWKDHSWLVIDENGNANLDDFREFVDVFRKCTRSKNYDQEERNRIITEAESLLHN